MTITLPRKVGPRDERSSVAGELEAAFCANSISGNPDPRESGSSLLGNGPVGGGRQDRRSRTQSRDRRLTRHG